jgi:hypothetical protein
MSRALVAQSFVFAVLTSCATISGLIDKEAVDCPGDCDGGSVPPRGDAAGGADGDRDTSGDGRMPLPPDWTLAARAPAASAPSTTCPSGMGNAMTVQESPVAQDSACTCACTPTAQATCSGQVKHTFRTSTLCNNQSDPDWYKNPVAGTCYQDLYTGASPATENRFTLPTPTGGACSATPTAHPDRVTYGETSFLCEDASRCSGGFCDARFDVPFEACVSRAGDEACPDAFPVKHLVGKDGAEFECGACTCTPVRAACQGAVHHYTDTGCTAGEVIIPANGLCAGPNTSGSTFRSYKVIATSSTTCSTEGSTAATNARMKNPRTVCCRK